MSRLNAALAALRCSGRPDRERAKTASVIAVILAAGVCFAAVRRSGYRPAYAALEFLRFASVCIAVAALNGGRPVRHSYRMAPRA